MPRFPDDPDEVRMSFAAHLEELRSRLVRSVVVIGGLFLFGWMLFHKVLADIVLRPHRLAVRALGDAAAERGLDEHLQTLSALEAVFFKLKISFVAALVIGLPYLLWQFWSFIAVGLYPRERRVIQRVLPAALGLAVAGVLFGYFLLIPLVNEFLYREIDPDYMKAGIRLQEYFGLFLMFTVSLTVVFQLPLLLASLGAVGILKAKQLRHYRRHCIVGAFVLAAVFTPPDPYSQVLMALPTILLFEIGVLLVAYIERRRNAAGTPE
ncbi:MAG TPA: twin-arginine translocase subunit TatC [Planctomycetota bacterium]